jgi:hypothetical protein
MHYQIKSPLDFLLNQILIYYSRSQINYILYFKNIPTFSIAFIISAINSFTIE